MPLLPTMPDTLGAWIATWWVHATVLSLAGWLVLRRRHELAPRLEQALVLFVLLAPWLTASLATRGDAHDTPAVAAPTAQLDVPTAPIHVAPPSKGARLFPAPPIGDAPTPEHGPTPPAVAFEPAAVAVATPHVAPDWIRLLLHAAFAVAGGIALFGIVRDRRAARALGSLDRQPLDAPLAEAARTLVARVGGAAQRARWVQTPDLTTPLTHGVRRPLVLLPERVVDLPQDERDALLAHELAHVVRRDALRAHVVRALGRLATLVPFASAVARRWSPAVERAADDLAAAWTGDRRALASCLVRVSAWHDTRRMPLAATAMADRPPHLQVRVERLLASPVRRAGALAACVLVAAGAGLGTVAFAAAPRPVTANPTADEPDTAVAPRAPLDVELEALDTELDELVELARRAKPRPELDAALARLAARRADLHRARQALPAGR
ncbi:MAG: hypothetical protein H6826_01040 [Planctomycetes bacterium]|nr:hypothetical protein [Planctomycetota bacterium]MCB9899908.1 hypothetical protein [Planctomycetota bacterium]